MIQCHRVLETQDPGLNIAAFSETCAGDTDNHVRRMGAWDSEWREGRNRSRGEEKEHGKSKENLTPPSSTIICLQRENCQKSWGSVHSAK